MREGFMRGHNVQKIIFIMCGLLICGFTVADVYKWTDENGKTRFSDKPPQERKADNIEKELQRTNVDSASGKMVSDVVSSSERTEDEKLLEQKKRQKLEDAIGSKCKKMKEDIQAIARGDRGSFLDENGKEELVLERDRGKKLEEWKSNYRKFGCAKLYPLE
jgi:hypothetical protein